MRLNVGVQIPLDAFGRDLSVPELTIFVRNVNVYDGVVVPNAFEKVLYRFVSRVNLGEIN